MKVIQSKITQVAVFTDRAQVSRKAKVILQEGNQILVFGGLPDGIDANSLQVTGAGNALLKDVKLETKYFTVNQREGLEELEKEKLQLQNEMKVLQSKSKRLESTRDLVENIASKITATSSNPTNMLDLQPDKWLQMIELHQSQLTKIDGEILSTQKEKYQLEQELDRLNREMNTFGEVTTKTQKQVQVVLEAKGVEEVVLKLSYVVSGASWYPVYDIRVDSDSHKVVLAYKAMVSQRTGEDWEEVQLQLSTAKPHISGNPPKLHNWFLSRYRPPKKSKEMAAITLSTPYEDMELDESYMEEEMERAGATVDKKAASVVFGVGSKTTVLSDNQAQQVNILHRSYKTDFVHTVVPSKSTYAYLKAKITNDSDYPLLKGTANIFMDNHFVAKSNIPFTASNANFEIGLGIDEAVKVTHQTLQNLRKTVGFMKNKEKMLYAYQTVIENNKSRAIHLTVHNQIPVSNDNDIEVELLNPVYEEDSDSLKKNNLGYIEWRYNIEASKKQVIDLKYSVVYPEGAMVIGLD